MKHIINTESKKQKGYSLVEIIACLALAGILGVGLATFAVQTITESSRAKNRMNAMMQVENAGFWMSRDIQMSENVTLGVDAGFPLQLVWNDMDANEYEVTYSVTEGQLKRSLVKNEDNAVQTLIAQYIDTEPSLTSMSYNDGLFTFQVSATSKKVTSSRSYQIKKRLDLLDL